MHPGAARKGRKSPAENKSGRWWKRRTKKQQQVTQQQQSSLKHETPKATPSRDDGTAWTECVTPLGSFDWSEDNSSTTSEVVPRSIWRSPPIQHDESKSFLKRPAVLLLCLWVVLGILLLVLMLLGRKGLESETRPVSPTEWLSSPKAWTATTSFTSLLVTDETSTSAATNWWPSSTTITPATTWMTTTDWIPSSVWTRKDEESSYWEVLTTQCNEWQSKAKQVTNSASQTASDWWAATEPIINRDDSVAVSASNEPRSAIIAIETFLKNFQETITADWGPAESSLGFCATCWGIVGLMGALFRG